VTENNEQIFDRMLSVYWRTYAIAVKHTLTVVPSEAED
jgi:hypothetical protein